MKYPLPIRSIIRETHTKEELRAIRAAADCGDRVFQALLSWLHIGVREDDVARKIAQLCKEYGATALSFSSIVAFGTNSAHPHHCPTARRLEKDMIVKIDFGCVVDGKCSDMTRTIFFGEPDMKFKKYYTLVLRAQRAALRCIRAGVRCDVVDAAARAVFKRAGVAKYFVHGTGHGISDFVHELPLFRPRSSDMLTAGMVVTVEPGIYIPRWGGIRIEDMVLVQKNGSTLLTKSTRTLHIVRASFLQCA